MERTTAPRAARMIIGKKLVMVVNEEKSVPITAVRLLVKFALPENVAAPTEKICPVRTIPIKRTSPTITAVRTRLGRLPICPLLHFLCICLCTEFPSARHKGLSLAVYL